MKCSVCRGACCESVVIPLAPMRKACDRDDIRWLLLHGRKVESAEQGGTGGHGLELEARCTKLDADGRCGIYDERPMVCRLFPAGGPDCLDTVRRRRSPEEYAQIRDADDPPRIHE